METLLTGIVPPKSREDAKQFVDFQHFLLRYAHREHGLRDDEQGLHKIRRFVHHRLQFVFTFRVNLVHVPV
jgi:hypothetical protein